jgi:hypothetical protein
VGISTLIRRKSHGGRDVLTVGDTPVGKIQDVILDDEMHTLVSNWLEFVFNDPSRIDSLLCGWPCWILNLKLKT